MLNPPPLDGRGKGEGDNRLKLLTEVVMSQRLWGITNFMEAR